MDTRASEDISYNRDVRPILASNCFACHGPDGESRKADLRLDSFEAATQEMDGIRAISPGNPNLSSIIERITSTDPDDVMPPPETGHAITPEQTVILKKWITQGAPYQKHWSFENITKPDFPNIKNSDWVRNGLDYFTLHRMESQGLSPNQEADRYSLIRRLYLDLVGLPPTWEEAQAFVNDPNPQAYDNLVDNLLDNPAYGEKWASMWLDLARYADSAGYGSDPLRTIWKYRDWVIEAFNKNLPYDEFTRDQLAGDLLENPTHSQMLATAFHRNTKTNTEGGTDDEEFRTEAVRDRVDTTMQVWMGLTMGCAKCHTHKYDPISIKEYYQFYDFFNQTQDSDRGDEFPKVGSPTEGQQNRIKELESQIKLLTRKTTKIEDERIDLFQNWISELAKPKESVPLELSDWSSVGPFQGKDFEDAHKREFFKPDSVDLSKEITINEKSLKWKKQPDWKDGQSYSLEGENSATYLYRELKSEKEMTQFISLGSDDSIQVWLNGKRVHENKTSRGVAPDQDQVELKLVKGTNKLLLKITNGGGAHGFYFKVKARNAPNDILALVDKTEKELSSDERNKLEQYFLSKSKAMAPFRKELSDAQNNKRNVERQIVQTPILRELDKSKKRSTHILVKGNFLSKGEKVQAAVPSAFHPLPEGAPANRLAIAEWLMDDKNPLTSRVAVNRYWARLFGKGLVETEEDFGTQGKMPSHPELLDWLAFHFQHDLDWDMKKFLKSIVTSATYRQSSVVTASKIEKDPNNIYLSRMTRSRLDAESVRDQALSVAGLLSLKQKGPSVYPPQPDGLWRAAFNGQRNWATSEKDDRYRRGVYTFLRRTIPYPSMATFDAPSRETCTVRRIPTNTPLQAFVTMNDPAFVEMAQGFASKILSSDQTTVEAKLQFALKTALVRPPTEEQIEVLMELYKSEVEHFSKNTEEAEKLLGRFKSDFGESIPSGEAAAWVVIANVILNLDGFLMKG